MFLINSLEGGGAEKVIATVATQTQARCPDMEVLFATLDNAEDKYVLPLHMRRIRMDSDFSLPRSFLNTYAVLRREKPDLVVAFLTRSNLIAALLGRMLGIRTIISERVNTSSHFAHRKGSGFYKALIRRLYPLAQYTICVSDGVRKDLHENFGMALARLRVINNPVDLSALKEAAQAQTQISLPDDFIVSVGRLVPNKNFDGLIRAYHRADPSFDLVILGEGPEREALEKLVSSLGLEGKVHLPGHVGNPHAIMKQARAYVSASRAEGFPNALVEAMAVGLPVISTDCESGPSEILDQDANLKVRGAYQAKFGILVPVSDDSAMAEAIKLLEDPGRCRRYGSLAEERAKEYSVDRAMMNYIDLMRDREGNSERHS